MLLHLFEELLPEILVLDGFFAGGFPSVPDPVMDPSLVERVGEIGAVGVNLDGARVLEGSQRFQRRRQLHSIVCSADGGPGKNALVVAVAQRGRPSARTRIAAARAVCVHDHRFLVFSPRHALNDQRLPAMFIDYSTAERLPFAPLDCLIGNL